METKPSKAEILEAQRQRARALNAKRKGRTLAHQALAQALQHFVRLTQEEPEQA